MNEIIPIIGKIWSKVLCLEIDSKHEGLFLICKMSNAAPTPIRESNNLITGFIYSTAWRHVVGKTAHKSIYNPTIILHKIILSLLFALAKLWIKRGKNMINKINEEQYQDNAL